MLKQKHEIMGKKFDGFSLFLDLVIRGQSVTQGSMGRDPRTLLGVQDYKKVKFP